MEKTHTQVMLEECIGDVRQRVERHLNAGRFEEAEAGCGVLQSLKALLELAGPVEDPRDF